MNKRHLLFLNSGWYETGSPFYNRLNSFIKKTSEMSVLLCNNKYLVQTEYTTGNHLSRFKEKKSASPLTSTS